MNLFHKMFPEFRTDHDGITFGDVVVLVISALLLVYTGWRSYDIIRNTLPQGDSTYTIVALVGLAALDLGMIGWALVWMFGSTTAFQDWISLGMWGIDALGVLLAVMADTFLYTPSGQGGEVMQVIQTVVWWAVPGLAVLNGVMGIVYHFTHPSIARRRQERRLQEEIARLRLKGEYSLRRQELEAELARDLVRRRQQHLQAYRTLVATHRGLQELERSLVQQLLGERAGDIGLEEAVRQAIIAPGRNERGEEARPKAREKKQWPETTRPQATTTGGNHQRPQYTPETDEWQ